MSTSSFWSGPVRGGGPSAVQAASMAGMVAAGNLFDKAVAALARGEEDQAHRLVRQAAFRPFDDHEGVWPGPAAAHFALFELVVDTVEQLPEGDDTWVDVLIELASRVSGRQLDELRHLAAVLDQDRDFHGVEEHEARRLRALAQGSSTRRTPGDDVAEDERYDYVLDLAHLVLALQTALQDAGVAVPAQRAQKR